MPKIIKHFISRKLETLVLLVIIFEFIFPHYALAAEINEVKESILLPNMVIKSDDSLLTSKKEEVRLILPIKQDTPAFKVIQTHHLTITAYSSTIDQTDDTPCITANGFDLCKSNEENVVAANFLPFGTKIRIPEYFGERIFTVQDRMHSRYNFRVDVWRKNRQSAVDFGIRHTVIEILE